VARVLEIEMIKTSKRVGVLGTTSDIGVRATFYRENRETRNLLGPK